MHTFTYHSVGQGLFFEGRFQSGRKEISLVYDCGTEKSYKPYLKHAISQFKSTTNHIDILVVSHFDFDHISGMHNLLKECTVSQIILPYLTDEEILIYLLSQPSLPTQDEQWYIEFLRNPHIVLADEFESIEKITFIVNEFDKSVWLNLLDISSEDFESNQIVRNYRNIEIKIQKSVEDYIVSPNLSLKFYNYPISPQKKVAFMNKVESEMKRHGDNNIHSLAHRVLSDLAEATAFKKSYSYLNKSNHNNVSLLMVYDFKMIKGNCLNLAIRKEQLDIFETQPHTYNLEASRFIHFFTGDISFKYIRKHLQIYEHYKDLLPSVDAIQVPHHGSKHNWNDDLLSRVPRKAFFIVSSGLGNSYRHPHTEVTKKIEANHKIFKANDNESIVAEIL